MLFEDSLELSESAENTYTLSFDYTSNSGLMASVFCFVEESFNVESFTTENLKVDSRYGGEAHKSLEPGIKAKAEFNNLHLLAKEKYFYSNDLVNNFYPMVIRLENRLSAESKDNQVVVTYCHFVLKKVDESVKVLRANLKQTKIEMGIHSWILKPIYGNESDTDKKTINLNSFKNECVMCFDEPTDVMIYPCRHLSIGYKCAQELRNSKKCRECPVCRGQIERFIKVNF